MSASPQRRLAWLDPIKALALLGILLNHLVEEFGRGPWFTNPSNSWPDLATRLHTWPNGPLPVVLVRWLGWLGDSGPGVFIFASGVGLAFAAAGRAGESSASEFYRRRLVRLFPLYIAAHLVILALALAVPGNDLALDGPRTLLSLLGLRFLPSLFFYINPSWWFVWTILQLYLAFPFLLGLLHRRGARAFLGVTIAVTLLARGAGILFSGHLYFWMTGLFAATRLAEFTVGMAVGWEAARRGSDLLSDASLTRLGVGSAAVYMAGLLASFVLPGTLVSNLLVTLGLVGLFVWTWRAVVGPMPALAALVAFIGAVSYPVYLIHQPPLMWAKALPGGTAVHLAFALGALTVSFPAARWLEKAVNGIPEWCADLAGRRWLAAGWSVALLAALPLVPPMLSAGGRADRLWSLLLGFSLLGIALLARGAWGPVSVAAVVAAALQLFVLPERNGDTALVIGAATGLVWLAARRWARRPLFRLAGALAAVGVIAALAEAALWALSPWETSAWGERPALEPHPTRVYGLKLSSVTRLRYNNYDYVVRTNSLGLPGPEVEPARAAPETFRVLVIGDAFTMPEGLPYEDAYPALLQGLLGRCMSPRPVQVINAGVTGYGPREELAQLRELAPLLEPNVVAYEFFANEFDDIQVSAEQRLAAIGLTRGSLRYQLFFRSQLLKRLRRLEEDARAGLTGRAAPWRHVRALLRFVPAGPSPYYAQPNLDSMSAALTAMQRTSVEVGAKLVVFYVPPAVSVMRPEGLTYFPRGEDLADTSRYDLARPWKELAAIASAHDLDVEDLTPALRAHNPGPVYFAASWHWTPEGHAVAAWAIAGALAARGLVPAACGRP